MERRALVSALAAALLLFPATRAAAGEPARPLRSLTFSCSVSISGRAETPGDAAVSHIVQLGHGSEVESTRVGSGETDRSVKVDASGSIAVDVISATDDAGLVVDVAENAEMRTRPKVRVVIGPEGTLFYDPKNAPNLNEEEIAVIRWMARGFYGDRPRVPGTAWTVDQSGEGRVDVERYRVLSTDRDRVTLDYALRERTAGTNGYDAQRAGSLVYDTALAVPVQATFAGSWRRQYGDTMSTTRSSITLRLVSDTFAAPRS